MKLYKVNCEIWWHNFYMLPTIQIQTRNTVHTCKNFAIEFHFLAFHVRFFAFRGIAKR